MLNLKSTQFMKNKFAYLSTLILAIVFVAGMNSCKKDPTALTLQTLVAGDIDLNGATAPTTVPRTPTIVASFSTDVDATTATTTSVTLIRDYDKATVATTVTVAGSKITIVPTEALATGALFKLNFAATIKSTDGEALTAIDRNFTTIGKFAPSGLIAYWN
jgi:hypothetical protein